MKISVVIPSYNLGATISKTIDSILNQDYPDKEVIVVDNLSSDQTLKILKNYGDKIKWVSEKDKGQHDAIIKGYKMCSGDIFAYLNADDWYEPDIFTQISGIFETNPSVNLVYGKCILRDPKDIDKKFQIVDPHKNATFKNLIRFGNLTYQPSTFYRKSSLIGMETPKNVYYFMMEYDLSLRALKHGKSFYLDRILANFLLRENQKSSSKNQRRIIKEVIRINFAHGGTVLSPLFLGYISSYIIPTKVLDIIKTHCLGMRS